MTHKLGKKTQETGKKTQEMAYKNSENVQKRENIEALYERLKTQEMGHRGKISNIREEK